MQIHKFKVVSAAGQPHFRLLMSDLHLGSVHANHAAILADLDAAQRVGARVLVNGDVFDAICPTDKRYDANVLHADVRGKKDLLRAIVDLAAELLLPYAPLIDIIGIGNHEEAWIRWNHSDPVAQLIEQLNREAGSRIVHGSFDGYIDTTFVVAGVRKLPRHKLLYYHGTGGDSPVTKGTIDFNRKGRNWCYDTLTFGHKHNLATTVESIGDVTPRGNLYFRKQLNLQTASYYQNFSDGTGLDPLDYSYAEAKSHPPKPSGGLMLICSPKQAADGFWYVDQDYATPGAIAHTRSVTRVA